MIEAEKTLGEPSLHDKREIQKARKRERDRLRVRVSTPEQIERKRENDRLKYANGAKKRKLEYYRARIADSEVRDRKNAYNQEYRRKPEVRDMIKERASKPIVREKQKEHSRKYSAKPAAKEKQRLRGRVRSKAMTEARRSTQEWADKMEAKEAKARYRDSPEGKAHARKVAVERQNAINATPIGNMMSRCRARLMAALNSKGFKKTSRTAHTIGCSWEFLAAHIERQFPKGMRWKNKELWEIDHIVPMATAKTPEDVIRLSHYTNLRPLWTADNRTKSARIITCQPELHLALL